jgi:hypothetical protein
MLIRGGRKDIIGLAMFLASAHVNQSGEERYYRNGYVFWLLSMLIRGGRKDIGMAVF